MKKLMILAGVLAAMLVVATPAFGQQDLQQPEEVSVTGVIQKPGDFNPQYPEWNITDETSGTEWSLVSCGSGSVSSFDDYVGQQVTVTGIVQSQGPVPDGTDLSQFPLCVSAIDPAEPAQGRTIYGTAGSDNLNDTAGSDTVYALGSGDTVYASNGNDDLYGGTGWDYITGGNGTDNLYGWRGSDWLDGGADRDFVYGWTGNDLVDGGSGDDEVYGGVGNDTIYGSGGSDNLYGWTGSDYLYSAGDGTYDLVYGGSGYDICVVGPEDEAYGCEAIYGQ